MADIFISYAHTTAKQAQAAAAALRAAGYSVWLDDDLAVHKAFSQVIEEQLTAAKAALVIWSGDAAKSQWVLSEANRAREDGKLVQLVIDKTRLPMPFDQVQCADLSGWSGEVEHPNWRRVTASVGELVVGRGEARIAPASPVSTTAAEPLLAVLAFDNLSGDPEMAYFSDGVSEEIQQTVARGADLKVVGRTSSFQFRGADKAVRKVVADLKATHILDGSVRRFGQRVRISAQLIECGGETALWSDRYDRDLTDIFALQDEIAAAVAGALKTAFARSRPAPPIDPAAYDLFLRAQNLAGRDFESFILKVKAHEETVARAPAFARGWAALAAARAATLITFREAAAASGLTPGQVTEAAETALRLDPDAGLAYQALANLEAWAAYGAREALNERALAAAPSDAVVLANAAMFCSTVGRVREGLALARRGYEVDPLLPRSAASLGVHLRVAGRLDEACRVTDAALERWPENLTLMNNAALFAADRGDGARAESVIRAWTAAVPAGDEAVRISIGWARNLLKPDAESIRGPLEEQRVALARTGTILLSRPVFLYRLGFRDEAFELLEAASFDQLFRRDGTTPAGTYFPGTIFDAASGMFRDPRFPRLCARLGLADYWVQTGKWPDCADDVPYDFRAEVRRLAGSA